jgi:hypothetical protein
MNRYFKLITSLIILVIAATIGYAQKLPNKQEVSLHAPSNIKIDGKTTEWNNQFQAYNHATDIFYTVSNDDNNLYLTVQATEPEIINKIIGGGITFVVQKSGKKNDKDGVSITYPIFDKKNRPYLRNGVAGLQRVISDGGGDVRIFKSGGDIKPVKIQSDSAMKVNNKRLGDNSKFIGVTGIKDLDTLISVYNTDGIKAAEAFDTQMAYTYELSVNLNKLGLTVSDAQKIAYHLTINTSSRFGDIKIEIRGVGGGAPSPEMEATMAKMNTALGAPSASTDFWGEYTLAKK